MIQKKICMLGSFAVGKTSLARRFVEGIFSDTYLTTVGVKIDKKVVQVNGTEINLVLWDLYGDDDFQKIRWSHFNGAAGYLLVADGTRRATLEKAEFLEERARKEIGPVPFIFLINKNDLAGEWEIDSENEAQLAEKNWTVFRTSAKTGEHVDEAFAQLARKIVG
ncbi:MAG TPA: Rab family GTPase [Candidatus Acidoferrales bacterium]|jgi:small GTP-binding protein|nr:Rab family GTPase [Candidatus Acidoferrales bacterium]